VRQGLLDIVLERNPIDIPESLIEHELHTLEAEYAAALQASGMPAEQAVETAHHSHDEFKARAARRAHSALILDALAEQEHVEVSEDEVANRVATIVSQAGRGREQAAKFYAKEENVAAIRAAMRREKTLDLLLERAQKEESADSGAQDVTGGGGVESGGGAAPDPSA
jgi:trigger factor